jgi:hypothetical protein
MYVSVAGVTAVNLSIPFSFEKASAVLCDANLNF